jgi:hypothetical protein
MTYILQAIIGKDSLLRESDLARAQVCHLAQGMAMIPLTDGLLEEVQETFGQSGEPFPEFEKLSASVVEWLRKLSEKSLVAYVEAEFWGGTGSQSAVVWQHGRVVVPPVQSQQAINQTLKLFGVEVGNERDEFNALWLGRHRLTEEWLTNGRS